MHTKQAVQPPDHGDEYGVTTGSALPVDREAGNTPSAGVALQGLCVVETSYSNGVGAAETTTADDSSALQHKAQVCESQGEDTASGVEKLDVAAREPSEGVVSGGRIPGGQAVHVHETSGAKAVMTTREEELSRAKRTASELESALRETRSEAQQLREMLATEKGTTRQQAAQLTSLR